MPCNARRWRRGSEPWSRCGWPIGTRSSSRSRCPSNGARADEDGAQPVNTDVLVEAARQLAERARTDAVNANRRGDFEAARSILKKTGEALRALAPSVREVQVLAAELEAEQAEFSAPMDLVSLKKRHFASYNVAYTRSTDGKAKRRPA